MSLWLSQQGAPATEVVARGNQALPKGWVISEHGKLQFSKSASRLFLAHRLSLDKGYVAIGGEPSQCAGVELGRAGAIYCTEL